jgi:hypothetical protein
MKRLSSLTILVTTSVAAMILWAGLSSPAFAEQDAASAAARGHVLFTSDSVNPNVREAHKPVMIAKAKAVGDAVISRPALADPHGFAIDWHARLSIPQVGMAGANPYPVRGYVLVRKIKLDARPAPKPDADGRYPGEGEGPKLAFTINDPFTLFSGNIEGVKPRPADGVFDLPADAEWNNGQIKLHTGMDTVLMIGRMDRGAPFTRLTAEQALTALVKELVAEGMPESSKPVQAVKAELAAMSADERQSPACRGGKEVPSHWLTNCAGERAVQKVKINHLYFDTSKPYTTVQLVAFRVGDPTVGEDKAEGDKLREAFAQLDVAAIRKLLD